MLRVGLGLTVVGAASLALGGPSLVSAAGPSSPASPSSSSPSSSSSTPSSSLRGSPPSSLSSTPSSEASPSSSSTPSTTTSISSATAMEGSTARESDGQWAIAIHGGVQVQPRSVSPEVANKYRESLMRALALGEKLLAAGTPAVDVVEAVVTVLEDDPIFNAGRGAVFNERGSHELDASIMDGRTKACGAVAAVTTVKNPIGLARLIMTSSPHVLLISTGAEEFADLYPNEVVPRVPNSYFSTQHQADKLQAVLRHRSSFRTGTFNISSGSTGLIGTGRPQSSGLTASPSTTPPRLPGSDTAVTATTMSGRHSEGSEDTTQQLHLRGSPRPGVAQDDEPSNQMSGTVGCVARDTRGSVAAATSTGGWTGKRFGRVGDTPIIGAGTYASDSSAAVSCTGVGEEFIRHSVARTVTALVEYGGKTLGESVRHLVFNTLPHDSGGVIAVSPSGEIVLEYNGIGMYRAAGDSEGRGGVAIWNEPLKRYDLTEGGTAKATTV